MRSPTEPGGQRTAGPDQPGPRLGLRVFWPMGLVVIAGAVTMILVALLLAPAVFTRHLNQVCIQQTPVAVQHVRDGFAQATLVAATVGVLATLLVAEGVAAFVARRIAGHMATDVAGILLAVLAVTVAAMPATPERTLGYYRLESWRRWSTPCCCSGRGLHPVGGLAAVDRPAGGRRRADAAVRGGRAGRHVVGLLLLRSGGS